jgi:hypothetical protein
MPRIYEPVRFGRDCPATLVPSGAEVIVPEGAEGTLTQALGASLKRNIKQHKKKKK